MKQQKILHIKTNETRRSIKMDVFEGISKKGYEYKIEKGSYDKKTGVLTIWMSTNFRVSAKEKAVLVERMVEETGYPKIELLIKYTYPLVNDPDAEPYHVQASRTDRRDKEEGYATNGTRTGNSIPGPAGANGVRRSNGKKRGGKKYEVNGDHILGSGIKTAPESMSEVSKDVGPITVKGEIFKVDSRQVKSGKELVSLYVTDKETSACCKFFFPSDDWQVMKPYLKTGEMVLIEGEREENRFEQTNVIRVKKIDKTVKEERIDDAEKKRIELHCHTKMSAKDGLGDIDNVVRTAAKWGQEAVAITDHGVVQAFPTAMEAGKKNGINIIYGMEGYVFDDSDCRDEKGNIDHKKNRISHIIILAATQKGMQNLYKLVTASHMEYFYKVPRLPRSLITELREGLIIGSACVAGEVYKGIYEGKSEEEMEEIASFYDYLEIQPLVNNSFMIEKNMVSGEEDLREHNRRIVELGERMGKPVVATTDAHYCEPEDEIYRRILQAGQGYEDEGSNGLYMRTTEEMLQEFSYLGREKAYEVVVENPSKIFGMTDRDITPIARGNFPPEIKDSQRILTDTCMKNAEDMYGTPLPLEIKTRLDRELDSIISNGYAVMYVAAKMLVDKSMSDGFLVGSRGSVGSSFAATMAGITEVNPLPPHYLCPVCKNLIWGDAKEYDCGVDMPARKCEKCGSDMDRLGFSIPFETFLGFEGDKEPDIDLNFAGEYQNTAQKYVEEIFGEKNVFKAGTIGTIQGKTAYGFVMHYFEDRGIPVNKYEADRLTKGCEGVKRTTGQHPGGIIILPEGHDIHEFCPVQHPANDRESGIVTTHFDYHAIDKNLLKLDILGHDAPSIIRSLQDMTGVEPLEVPLNDEKVDSLFTGTEALDIKVDDYKFDHGSFGIPEFGTAFVRQMLDDIRPEKFGDLVRISGFSHGTNVWLNNARDYIKSGEATMSNAISTRDDIMNYLILQGMDNREAFTIMEKVRKGKGVTDEQAEAMKVCGVPSWYVDSCRKISYMFPRAHAVAYVIMAYRIAYFKVYYPPEFYAAYLTMKVEDFDWSCVQKGREKVWERIEEISMMGTGAKQKERDSQTVLEVVYEMLSRGYSFIEPDLKASKGTGFYVRGGRVQVPFCVFEGMGEQAAMSMEKARDEMEFATVEDIRIRGGVNKTAVEAMRDSGMLEGLPETDQIEMSLL